MPTCKLCKKREATQTGSHIFPFSLIKEAINFRDDTKRDKEVAFSFSTASQSTLYVGRSVLDEKLDDMKDDLKNVERANSNIFTEDYLLCPNCEKRLSVIEGYFSEKVIEFRKNIVYKDQEREIALKKADSNLIRIYIYSLFWRASVRNNNKSFSMKPKHEETLRKYLNECLDDNIEIVIAEASSNSNLKSLPVIALHADKLDDLSKGIVLAQPYLKNPYVIIAARFTFILYMKARSANTTLPHLFGLDKYVTKNKHININENVFKFGKIFKDEWDTVMNESIYFCAMQKYYNYLNYFSWVHERVFNKKPSEELKNKFRELISLNSGDITNEEAADAIVNSISKFYKLT